MSSIFSSESHINAKSAHSQKQIFTIATCWVIGLNFKTGRWKSWPKINQHLFLGFLMPQDRKIWLSFERLKLEMIIIFSKNSPVRRIFIATTNVAKRRSRTVRCQMWKQKNERCGLRDHFFFCKLLIFSTEWSENNAANPTQKGCLLGVPSWLQHFFRLATKKMILGQKYSIFGSKKGHFGQSGPRSGLPSLRIWETFDPIESGPSEPKKMGVHRWSIKMQNFGPKMHFFLAQNRFFSQMVQIFCYYHDWTVNTQ